MLQNNVAPNIGQNLSSNQWPVILGSGLYTTYRGVLVASVGSHHVQCNSSTFETLL